jgi:choline-sulfatase
MLLVLLALLLAPSGPADSLRARNVVFIMGDDHAAGVMGAYGNPLVRTPNLDRLAAQGARFERAYANSPVCTPSRQSILTGKLPHAAGVTLLRTPLAEGQVTIAEHLQARGYRTAAIGKMHFNSSLPHGFGVREDRADHRAYLEAAGAEVPAGVRTKPPWRPFRDPARVWLNADALPAPYTDRDAEGTFFAHQAIDFIEANASAPFCLWVSFYEPHSPFDFPVEYAGRYDPQAMPLPPTGPDDARWMPAVFAGLTDEEKRGIVAAYYTSVEYLDKNVGLVLEAIDRLGLAENTLVVYVGDHGYLLGDHGRFEKHMMWEPAVRAPLLIRAPGLTPRVTGALVEFVDLVPTILDVLQAPPMDGVQGRSLVPLLEGRTERHRDAVFSEFLPDNKAMVRTDRWKYVFSTGARDLAMGYETGRGPVGIEHRLYDTVADPMEHHDLAGDPRYAGVLKTLQLQMLDRFITTHPYAEALPPQLSLEEALIWFCVPPEERSGRQEQ